MTVNCFAPMEALASALIRHTLEPSDDGAHDLAHLQRVWHTARTLHATEGGDLEVLLAAVLLHDCVSVEKTRRYARKLRVWQRTKLRPC